MKKSYLIILIALLVVAAYFFFSKRSSTLKSEYSDFAINDTSTVNKIFIADYSGNTALLERQADNTWKINGMHKVRKDGIDLLLKTFKLIEVREPVPKSARETVIKELAVKSTKVEVYTNGKKPNKVYYVGHATKSHYGTNMLLELDGKKSSEPFVTHVPGFFGYLSTRFFTEEDLWRHRGIFELAPEEIASIEIRYLENSEQSFRLTRNGESSFALNSVETGDQTQNLNVKAIETYLEKFASIHYEFIDKESGQTVIDSVKKSPPLHQITVRDQNGVETVLKTYYKPVTDGTADPITGETYKYNLDRLYGWVNDDNFVVMQWPTLDQLLIYRKDFLAGENVEN